MIYLVHANIYDLEFNKRVWDFKKRHIESIKRENRITTLPLHITLMRGEFDDNEDILTRELSSIGFKPFEIRLGKLRLFEENSLVSLVLSDKITNLHRRVLDRLKRYEIPNSSSYKGKYTPHMTLFKITNTSYFEEMDRNSFSGNSLRINEFRLSKKEDYWRRINSFPIKD